MNSDKNMKRIYYLIIVALSIFILFLIKQLLQYPFYHRLKDAIFNVFFPFFISFVIVYIFHPVLFWFEKRFSIKTWVSTLILLITYASLLVVLINVIFPILGNQLLNLFLELPKYLDQTQLMLEPLKIKYSFLNNANVNKAIMSLKDLITTKIGTSLVDFIINAIIFSAKSLWLLIMIPILVFIMMKDYANIHDKLSGFLIRNRKSEWIQLLRNIDKKLGAYVRGQFMIIGYMFTGTFILLLILGVQNAFIFAIIIAFTNVVPFIGPYVGGLPLCIFSYFQSPHLLIGALGVILFMQQFDGNIGQPLVYGTQLKIHPLIIIIVMLIGSAFGGVIGIVASIPIYIIASEIFNFFKPKLIKKSMQ